MIWPFNDYVDLAIAIHDEYVSSIKIYEPRRKHANLVLKEQRLIMDQLLCGGIKEIIASTGVEMDEPLQKMLLGSRYLGLLNDTARVLLSNGFGSATETIGAQADNLEIRFILLNEVIHKACVVFCYHRTFKVSPYPVPYHQVSQIALDLSAKLGQEDECDMEIIQLLRSIFSDEAIQFMSRLEHVDNIVIYPDGVLWKLPWQWLMLSLSSAFAGTNLRTILTRPVLIKLGCQPLVQKPELNEAAIMAAWNYSSQDKSRSIARRGIAYRDGIPSLPYVLDEAKSLRPVFEQKWSTKLVDNPDAYEVLMTVASLKGPAIVHLSCHGALDAIQAVPTIVLPSKSAEPEYSLLHYESVLRVSWANCRLLFLNACFAGYGRPHTGGIPTGLHEALAIAGVSNVIAPLWPVWDDLASEFAQAFYGHFVDDGDIFRAYRAALHALGRRHDARCKGTAMAYQLYSL